MYIVWTGVARRNILLSVVEGSKASLGRSAVGVYPYRTRVGPMNYALLNPVSASLILVGSWMCLQDATMANL